MSTTQIEKFYSWINLKTKKWNYSSVKSLLSFYVIVQVDGGNLIRVTSRSSKLRLLWLWDTVLPGLQVNCSEVPLKMFWFYCICRYHAHAHSLREESDSIVLHTWLVKNVVEYFDFFKVFFSSTSRTFLGLQLHQNWSIFSRTFFDKEITSFHISLFLVEKLGKTTQIHTHIHIFRVR